MHHPAYNVETLSQAIMNIRAYRARYYDGDPDISDDLFDSLLQTYRQRWPQCGVWDEVGAPTPGEKIKHSIPMASLDNAIGPQEFLKWCEARGLTSQDLIMEYKLDGLSVALTYVGGQLSQAVTRGDGVRGESVLHNMRHIVPNALPGTHFNSKELVIRGEVMVLNSVFDANLPDMKNARNAAAGLVRRQTGSQHELLTFFAFSISGSRLTKQSERLVLLQEMGFTTAPAYRFGDMDGIICGHEDLGNIRDGKTLSKLPMIHPQDFNYDGMVVKVEDDYRAEGIEDKYGRSATDNPASQVAFKWVEQARPTRLIDIEWQVGKTGAVTPVAILDPVEIGGATITKASLFNLDYVQSLGLKIGQLVDVIRAGEVIPKVQAVSADQDDHEHQDINIPHVCPCCATTVQRLGPILSCPNPQCPAQAVEIINSWFAKRKIMEWGPAVIQAMYDAEYRSINDYYTQVRFAPKPLLQALTHATGSEIVAKKQMQTLKDSLDCSLADMLGSYGIFGLGRTAAQDLLDQHPVKTVEEFINFVHAPDKLESLNGWAKVSADNLRRALQPLHTQLLELEGLLHITQEEKIVTDKTVCFTGVRISDEQAKAMALKGYKECSGVSARTTLLVAKDPAKKSGKVAKAEKAEVPIMSLDEFLKHIA